ncbi:IS630 family transposase [Paenibacillus herberti]|uniref:IS630 family transposase n=2 Tax=Paenibacillus herberti TaxID=1619309 RepID=A0A229P3E5_9BACL|nr:IS630 family transposase [Paenibacillus herberti]OXM16464.1 IS630 family transposase [Paenibacillus herberti]
MKMSTAEMEKLNVSMRETSDKRLYERYLAVRLRFEGHSFEEIGHLLNRTRQTISLYWQAYQERGLAGLEMDHSPGQPTKLTDEQRSQLGAMLEQKTPVDVGFEARHTWTLPLVAEWIKMTFGVTMSVRGISAMLGRMNFSFTKATYSLVRADADAQALFRKQTFAQLKKQVEAEEIDHLLFEDESMIRSYQALQYNWFPRGRQRKVPTYGKHEGAKLFGAINYETGQVHHREEEKADVAAFVRFLEDLLSVYPSGKMALILDNSRIHHAKALQPFLKKHPRLQLVFLPPYSPNLNPVEGLWLWLKADVVNNVFFEKFYKIKLHVSQFMNRINKNPMETIDRLLVWL